MNTATRVAPPKASARQTPRALWSDGIHFVRSASIKDRHPMRFVIAAHKNTASTFSRHVETLDQGIARAREQTSNWLKTNPEDHQHWTEAPLQEAADTDGFPNPDVSGTQNSATPKPTPSPFSIAKFNCIEANPVAQVWQCVSRDRRSGGRKRKDGSAAQTADTVHDIGECAILMHKEPVRNPDGSVRIFTRSQASENAQLLYDLADGEDRFYWTEGSTKVWSTLNVDVIFDPHVNGWTKPFSLWLPKYNRPVYEDRTKTANLEAAPRRRANVNAAVAVEIEKLRRKHKQEFREPTFEERPLRFRTIYGAIEEAERRECMLKGETVL